MLDTTLITVDSAYKNSLEVDTADWVRLGTDEKAGPAGKVSMVHALGAVGTARPEQAAGIEGQVVENDTA